MPSTSRKSRPGVLRKSGPIGIGPTAEQLGPLAFNQAGPLDNSPNCKPRLLAPEPDLQSLVEGGSLLCGVVPDSYSQRIFYAVVQASNGRRHSASSRCRNN
jgi:hypothetical protein